jgi:hypothetical protein
LEARRISLCFGGALNMPIAESEFSNRPQISAARKELTAEYAA